MQDISSIRKEYSLQSFDENDADAEPVKQFEKWWRQAESGEVLEFNAMTLATVNAEGKPSARIVLLKAFDDRGFVFYTNYDSRKGQELAANPHAALILFWKELERQVRIEGVVEKLPESESDAYFSTRPHGSKLGAWASPQSQVIDSRALLNSRLHELKNKFGEEVVPRPENWGGYLLKPVAVEFWQGRPDRMHDRLKYNLEDGQWKMHRLAP